MFLLDFWGRRTNWPIGYVPSNIPATRSSNLLTCTRNLHVWHALLLTFYFYSFFCL